MRSPQKTSATMIIVSMKSIRKIIRASSMPDEAEKLSETTFLILAQTESKIHGKNTNDVTFHEVGALDNILDICMACRVFVTLAPIKIVCGPLPLTDGVIHCARGLISSPAPAVLNMLEGIPVRSLPGKGETATPKALALLKALGAEFGLWPNMIVRKTCIGYGTKIFHDAPNGAIWALGESW